MALEEVGGARRRRVEAANLLLRPLPIAATIPGGSSQVPNQRILRSVLAGFLGTYTGRYSEYQGFWLFGFLELQSPLEVNLLNKSKSTASYESIASDLARVKFSEQLQKHGFEVSIIRHAVLTLSSEAQAVTRMAGDFAREGFDTIFRVSVVTGTEKRLEDVKIVFVAPHDERFERRSGRHNENP